jgi:hypothetical protein
MSILTRLNVFGIPIWKKRTGGTPTVVRPSASYSDSYVSPYYTVKSGGIPNYNKHSKMPSIWLRKCGGMDYDSERNMFRKNINEAYTKFGVPMVYFITTYDTTYDRIYGEDCDRRYTRRFEFKARFGLQTEESMWGKFARYGIDNFPLWVSKDHFRVMSTYGHDLVAGNIGKNTYPSVVPKEGDIIQSKYNKYLYEIISAKENDAQFHLSRHYVWDLTVKPYTNNSLSLDPDTSASMSEIIQYNNINDIFGISADLAAKIPDVEYPTSADTVPVRDPFGGW